MAPHPTPPSRTSSFIPRFSARSLKIAAAASVSLIGLYGLVCEQGYVSSSDAVVSAYLLEVRTPIGGNLSGLPSSPGVPVRQGEVLGRVEDPRTDHQAVEAFAADEASARSEAEALLAEQKVLGAERRALLLRSQEHTHLVQARFDQQVTAASRSLAARDLSLQEATVEYNRARLLHGSGILATAEFDKLTATQRMAQQEFAAGQAELRSLRVQADSASRGLYAEPGVSTDVPYSMQRADDIAIRLAENTRAYLAAEARVREDEARLQLASRQFGLRQRADLLSPITGLLWEIQTLNGEHAAGGDAVVSLVDCSHQFVLASIPQQRTPEITPGERVAFRLSGESSDRAGTVLSILGDSGHDARQRFASLPAHVSGEQPSRVLIGFDVGGGPRHDGTAGCEVGRTARVLIPAQGSFASSLLRRFF